MTSRPRWALPLRGALIAAFALISVVAVVALLVVENLGVGAVLDELDRPRREAVAADVAQMAAVAHGRADGWAAADLGHAQRTAAGVGAWLSVTAADGTSVGGAPRGGGPSGADVSGWGGDIIETPILSGGQRVGTARLVFVSQEAAAHRAHDFLWGWAVIASGFALVAAAVLGWVLARRLASPLSQLATTAESYARGDRHVRTDASSRVTEVRRLAVALDSMAAAVRHSEASQQRMVGDIAHELRNPLAVVQGRLEELRDGLAPADPAAIGALHSEVLRLARVVEDLGALAEAEQQSPLRAGVVDLGFVVDQAVRARSGAFDNAGIGLDMQIDSVWVHGDMHRLGQVVGNLLDNCVRHCRAGDSCRVSIQRAGDVARLVVSDTGPGVADSDLPHLFERRYRATSATGPGRGIGLAVVRELVAAHGGTVVATSSVGEGTVLTVRLPLWPGQLATARLGEEAALLGSR